MQCFGFLNKCPALQRYIDEKLAITVQSRPIVHTITPLGYKCCTKIDKSEKTILFRSLWAKDF